MYSIGSIQSVHCGPTVGGYVILVGLQELVDDGLRMLKGTFQEHCSKMFHSILCDPVDLGNSSCLAFATFHSNLFGSVMYGNVNSLSRSLKNHQEFKPNMLPHFISVHVRSCPYSDNAGSEKTPISSCCSFMDGIYSGKGRGFSLWRVQLPEGTSSSWLIKSLCFVGYITILAG